MQEEKWVQQRKKRELLRRIEGERQEIERIKITKNERKMVKKKRANKKKEETRQLK